MAPQMLTFLGGAASSAAGVLLLSRRDAACITDALHPALRATTDPMYRQDLSHLPLQWECTWLEIPGHPLTTSSDALASLFYSAGILLMVVAVIWMASAAFIGREARA